MGQIGKGLEYLKSIPCILKIIEFVVLLVAIGLVGYFLNEGEDFSSFFFDIIGKKGNLQFFMFAVVVGWILVIVLFVLFVSGLHEKVPAVNWPLTVAIISAVWAVILLISSALLVDSVSHYEGKNFCDSLDKGDANPQCGQLIGGTVCGFIAMGLFGVDVLIHFRMYMTRESAPAAPAVQT